MIGQIKEVQPIETPDIPDDAKSTEKQAIPGLPDPDLISYYVLENDRKLYFANDVDISILKLQRMILRWNMEDAGKPREKRKPITLYILSLGGDVDMMWSLIDTIEASETPVYTVNMGVAASAAGLIFLAGHKRFMLKHSRVIIHEGSAHMSGDAVKVMDAGESYKKVIKQMKEYVLQRTHINASVLNRQKCHDWELDSTYCLQYGVCDIVIKKLNDII